MVSRINAVVTIVFAAILCGQLPAHAGADLATTCREAKAKGAGKKAAAALKAIGKNLKDPDASKLAQSLSKADSKFTKAFSKAEANGGCNPSGDVAPIGKRVDIFIAQMTCAVTPNCEGVSGDVNGGDSVTTDNENCTPECEDTERGLNCPADSCDGATNTDVIETRVTASTSGTISIAEYEFPVLGDLSVEIEAPQASPVDPLQILFILDSSLFGVLDLARMELVEVYREGVKVPDCLTMSGVADPDPCISQRSLVDGDLYITVLASAASTWTFDQLPFGPVGPEFQVNTYTTGNQTYFSKSAAAAFDGSGNFVVVWQSDGQDGDGFGIFAQRYDSLGAPLGSEFPVNTYTTGAQTAPVVAAASSGDFVVAWQSYDQDGDGYGIFGQRYDSTGATQGSEFQVNTYTTGDQGGYFGPGVAVDADAAGNFIVVWESMAQDGDGNGVFAQRYDSAGVAQGSEFQVNTHTTGDQGGYATGGIDVAADPAGNFVVVWQSYAQDGDYTGVFGQRYDNGGAPQGPEFQVNTYTTGYQGADLAVATDPAGSFIVAWSSYSGQDGDGSGIFGQRYDSAGVAQGSEFQVNTYTSEDQGEFYGGGVSVAADPAGNFVVVWQSNTQDGSDTGIFGQRYDNAGVAQGPEFQVNTYTTNYQDGPTVSADGNARFVVVWSSYGQDGDNEGVFAQRFATK